VSQIKTKWIEDGAITAAKLDSSGNFTMNKLTTTSDSTVGGNLKVNGIASFTGALSLTDATLSGGLKVGTDASVVRDLSINRDSTIGGALRVVGNVGVNTDPNSSYSIDVDTAGLAMRLSKMTGNGLCQSVLGWYAGGTQSSLIGARGLVLQANDTSNLELRTSTGSCNIILDPNDLSVTVNGDTTHSGTSYFVGNVGVNTAPHSSYSIDVDTAGLAMRLSKTTGSGLCESVLGWYAGGTQSALIGARGLVLQANDTSNLELRTSTGSCNIILDPNDLSVTVNGDATFIESAQILGTSSVRNSLYVYSVNRRAVDASSTGGNAVYAANNNRSVDTGFFYNKDPLSGGGCALKAQVDSQGGTAFRAFTTGMDATAIKATGYSHFTSDVGIGILPYHDAALNVVGASGQSTVKAFSPDFYAIDASSSGTAATIRVQNMESGGLSLYAVAGNNSAIAASNNSVPADTAYFENGAAGGTVLRATTTMPNGKAIIVDASDPDGTAIVATGKSFLNGNVSITGDATVSGNLYLQLNGAGPGIKTQGVNSIIYGPLSEIISNGGSIALMGADGTGASVTAMNNSVEVVGTTYIGLRIPSSNTLLQPYDATVSNNLHVLGNVGIGSSATSATSQLLVKSNIDYAIEAWGADPCIASIYGHANTSKVIGVFGFSNASDGTGVYAYNSSTGPALSIEGEIRVDNLEGDTTNVVISGVTLHFTRGILTSVS